MIKALLRLNAFKYMVFLIDLFVWSIKANDDFDWGIFPILGN
ncbi:MAG: hypothetical protein V4620_07750 [Bacteroidota bacterium]